jgi:glycosyltransferase involved in cell wall biosynthesis
MAGPRILATICTNRSPEIVRPSLQALAAQTESLEGAEPLLVTSGVGAEEVAALQKLAAELQVRTANAGAGLSVARNRAIEEARDDEVVAFLDDDAIPEPEWLANLRARWAAAPEATACIGGAIEPRIEGRTPAWFGEGVWTSYSLLDRGTGLIELSPGKGEDVWGANVSFRAGEVRAAGGFDPARGPWMGIPLFGDESDLERRLEDAGRRIFYAGDVRVGHVIEGDRLTIRSLGRRERWRGASLVIFGLRRPLSAVPRLPKAIAGLVAALAGGNAALAAERRARAAREAGVLFAPYFKWRLRRRGWPG